MAVTIVFRGLMVFADLATGKMEIGVLRAPSHIPRILTMRKGVIESVLDLRAHRELDRVRDWEIEVTNPTTPGVRLLTNGVEPFNRLDSNAHPEWDFRWIIDLEGRDLHDRSLTPELETRFLRFVIGIRHGEFSTRLQSPSLHRRRISPAEIVPYGLTAAVTACSISLGAGGTARLMAGGTRILELVDSPDIIYEFTNSPPDVDPGHVHPRMTHFGMYYRHLFKADPDDMFDLVPEGEDPAPDPALCGAAYLSRRDEPPF